jgi:cobalt-zinc-cadmium resistance protein CzcA
MIIQENMRTPQQLAQLPIRLPNGGLIQLQDVAKVEKKFALHSVLQYSQRQYPEWT